MVAVEIARVTGVICNPANYTGIDITQNHLALTQKNFEISDLGTPYRLIEGDLLTAEFDEPFDTVYSFGVLPLLGRVVAKDEASYRYLAESIRKHPNQETLAGLMTGAGLERVSVRNLLGGIVAIHSGYAV